MKKDKNNMIRTMWITLQYLIMESIKFHCAICIRIFLAACLIIKRTLYLSKNFVPNNIKPNKL